VARRPEREVPAQTAALAAELDGEANLLRTTVLDRAGTLGSLRQVQMAAATDGTTAHDMRNRGELGFELQPGEVVELGTVPKGAPFADRMVFLVLPDGTKHTSPDDLLLGASASWLEGCDHQVPRSCAKVVYTTVFEMPAARPGGDITGYLLVTRHLDLNSAVARLAAASGDARCGERRAPPSGWLELATAPASGIGCFMEMPASGRRTASIWLGAAAALAGLILVAASTAHRSARTSRSGLPRDRQSS